MTSRTILFGTIAAISLALSAGIASAQVNLNYSQTYAFQRDGVFGCSLNGSYSMSVGTMSALGGAYVPVNDASVTLNTGYLVYKECILREVVNRQRDVAIVGQVRAITTAVETGRNGNPLYSTRPVNEDKDAGNRAVLQLFQSGAFNSLKPEHRDTVIRALARGYTSAVSQPGSEFSCAATSDGSFWGDFSRNLVPGCDALTATIRAQDYLYANRATAIAYQQAQRQYGRGFYPRVSDPNDPYSQIVTPASVVEGSYLQALTSGFRIQERANDVGQMVNSLFAGLATQAIADGRGLSSLVQGGGGQASYLERLAQATQTGLIGSIVNAALQNLLANLEVEKAYNAIMTSIASTLSQVIAQLRSTEDQCWALIIDNVCELPPIDGMCFSKHTAAASSTKLMIATSTYQFAQRAINAQVGPLASSTIENINASNVALALLQQLIEAVRNDASPDSQKAAIQALDRLISEKRLHTQLDLRQAQQTQQEITTAMASFVQETRAAWGDSPDPNVGWCNINNVSVIQMWTERWKAKEKEE